MIRHKHSNRSRNSREREEKIKRIRHYDAFYRSPPRQKKQRKGRPEDSIPDLPENKEAREFLSKAPTKGLWMPLGKEVKVMQCWSCKGYGHRSGDKDCPMFLKGSVQTERFRWSHEDPMRHYIENRKQEEKEARVEQLKALIESSSSSDTDCSSVADKQSSHSRKRRKKSKPHKSKRKKLHLDNKDSSCCDRKRSKVCDSERHRHKKDKHSYNGKEKHTSKSRSKVNKSHKHHKSKHKKKKC